jgi:hypothetical protein
MSEANDQDAVVPAHLVAGYFDMADGGLSALDEATGAFTRIGAAEHRRALADPNFAENALCPHCGAPALKR